MLPRLAGPKTERLSSVRDAGSLANLGVALDERGGPDRCGRGHSVSRHASRLATGDASSWLVEAYRPHPNAIKALAHCGQGYLLSDEGLAPVAYPMMPASADYPLPRKDQSKARGLRLYETFVAG
jgi:hypothetical protein